MKDEGSMNESKESLAWIYVNHVYQFNAGEHDTNRPIGMSCRKRKTNDRRGQRDPESLSERIYQWREARNLSQSEAAIKLKLSKRTLQEWEQGRAAPTHLGLIALDATIGRPINQMAGRRRRKRPRRH